MTVEGGKFSAVVDCEGEEVVVGEELRRGKGGKGLSVGDGDVVGPELVAGGGEVFGEVEPCFLHGAGAAEVVRMTEDAEEAVLRKRAGCPALFGGMAEEFRGGLMVGMVLIHQREEDIYIQQEDHGLN